MPQRSELCRARLPRRLSGANVARVVPAARSGTPSLPACPGRRVPDRDREPEHRSALFHAGGREAEVEEVFRRILASGAPLDQVEIACASDAHVSLIWEKALRHDWPVTLGPGIAAPRRDRAVRCSASAIGLRPTSRPAISVGCSSPAIMGIEQERRTSPRVRRRDCLRGPKPGGAEPPTALALGRCARSTSHARSTRMCRMRTRAVGARSKADVRCSSATGSRRSSPRSRADGPMVSVVLADGRRRRARVHRGARRAQPSAIDRRAAAALSNTSANCARLAPSRARSAGAALHQGTGRRRCTSRRSPTAGHLHVCTLATPASPAARSSSSSGSRRAACSRRRSEDPILLDAERAPSRRRCALRPISMTKPSTRR